MRQPPTSQCPTVRLVLAISLDGRLAPPEGGAAQLGGSGDRRALEQALAWADACLIGAGTLRAHQCTCLIRNPQLLKQRLQEGRSQQPAAVVVSRSLGFSRTWRFFDQPLQRWLLAPAPMHQGFDRWFLGANSAGAAQSAGRSWDSAAGAFGWRSTLCRSVASRLRRRSPAHSGAPAPWRSLQLVATHGFAIACFFGATGRLAVRWC